MKTVWHCAPASIIAAFAATLPLMAQAQLGLAEIREKLKLQQSRLDELEQEERQLCALAKVSFRAFAADPGTELSKLATLARAAAQTRDACSAADQAARLAKGVVNKSWSELNALLQPPALPRVLVKGVDKLIEAAAGAQELVDTARSKYADPYEAGDTAAVAYLKSADLGTDDRKDLLLQVQQARESAKVVRQAISAAQGAANSLVSQAVLLKSCQPGCRDSSIQLAADDAHTRLTDALQAAKTEFSTAKMNHLTVTVGVAYTDKEDRQNAIEFARVLDTFPDARSVLGEASAFGLTANGNSTVATVKLGGAKNLPYGWRQTSFTLSTPLDSNENPRLYQHGAGFNNAASLGASTYWVLGGTDKSLFKGKTYMTAGGLNGSVGLGGKLSYLLDDLKTEQQAERLFREGSVGAYIALFRQARDGDEPVGNPRVHLLSLNLKRSVTLGNKETRCPVPIHNSTTAVRCVTANFTPPSFDYTRNIGYEYRYQAGKWVVAPKVSHEDKDSMTTVRVPFYWIRSSDPDAKGAFNAGVDWVWSRGRGTDGKRTTESTVGVFVGMPFSLGAVDRD